MALKGTISDFGIADIFQLIGQQRKTGVLVLNDQVDDIRIHYRDGNIIRAESATRPKQMLLGNMLVNAELVTSEQLSTALETQRRTLQRLGAVLLEMGFVTTDTINEVARLQLTETIYRTFQWTTGTYEFEQTEVEPVVEGVEPIPAETILMEGIRMVDEWPIIRSKLPPYATVIEQAKPLPIVVSDGAEIGPTEQQIYDVIADGCDLQSVIHKARLGEFEACRAVATLLDGGYVRAQIEGGEVVSRSNEQSWMGNLRPGLVIARVVGYVLLFALVIFLARSFDASWYGVAWGGTHRVGTTVPQRFLAHAQIRTIRRALDVHRLEKGAYPKTLSVLVKGGYLSDDDIRFPFDRPYAYQLVDGKPTLYAPTH